MKTRLEYHLRKFKKRYQFKQIGNKPNYGTINIDGYVFEVELDLRKIGRSVNRPYHETSIFPRERRIFIPKMEILQKQSVIHSSLYHEIAHFILWVKEYDLDISGVETYCDLFSAIHTGIKNQKKSMNYVRNKRRLFYELCAIQVTDFFFMRLCCTFGMRVIRNAIPVRTRIVDVHTKRKNRTYVKRVIKSTSWWLASYTIGNNFIGVFRACRRLNKEMYRNSFVNKRDPILNYMLNTNPEDIDVVFEERRNKL